MRGEKLIPVDRGTKTKLWRHLLQRGCRSLQKNGILPGVAMYDEWHSICDESPLNLQQSFPLGSHAPAY
jgi:hypothetical protein